MRIVVCTAVAGMMFGTSAVAEEKREADAHEHGHGTFNMAIEDKTVVIELETPAFDILGFEHAAKSADEKEAVHDAREVLAQPVALFGLAKAAGCAVTEAEIEIGAEADHDDHDDDHDHGHDDDHDDHADGDKHDDHDNHDDHDDDHKEEHDDHHDDEAEHSEVHAHFTLTCDAPEKISSVNMSGYFKAFPNAEELDAAILSDAGQASGELEPDRPELSL